MTSDVKSEVPDVAAAVDSPVDTLQTLNCIHCPTRGPLMMAPTLFTTKQKLKNHLMTFQILQALIMMYLYHIYLQIVNLSPPLTSLPLTLQNQNNDRLRDHNQNKC